MKITGIISTMLMGILISTILAQSFTFIPNDTIAHVDIDSMVQYESTLSNISDSTITTEIIRMVNDLPEDWESIMCLGGLCYFQDTIITTLEWEDTVIFQLDVLTYNSTSEGTGHIQIVVFNVNNPTEIVTVNFIATTDSLNPGPPNFATVITADDNAGVAVELTLGFSPDATDGYDPDIDMYAPPVPPGGFDVALRWPSGTGDRFFTQILNGSLDDTVEHIFDIQLQYPDPPVINLIWDNTELPDLGNFTLVDPWGGDSVNVDMTTQSSLQMTNTYLTILLLKVTPFPSEIWIEPSSQVISLTAGWSIFSSYVITEDVDMLSVVQPLIDAGTLDKVLDEAGNAILYFMGNWINNIGDLANTEGYYVKVNDDVDLTVEGNAVELPFEIDLTAGWNIMGYPTDGAQNGLIVVQPLIDADELEKVLDETGNAILYFFGEWVNNIGDFEAGEGYYIKVIADATLPITAPALARAEATPYEDVSEATLPVHFTPVFTGNPFMPMGVYLVGKEFSNLYLEVSDEVAVFDDDLCVGTTVVESEISIANPLIIIASMDDEIGMPGFSEGNPISYRIWDASENRELSVDEVTNYDHETGNELNTEPSFERLGTIAVSFKSYTGGIIEPMIPETFALHQNYPNPFNPITTIRYDLPEQSYVTILIYDILGRQIKKLINEIQPPGFYQITWDATDYSGKPVSSGLYIFSITADEHNAINKMLLLR